MRKIPNNYLLFRKFADNFVDSVKFCANKAGYIAKSKNRWLSEVEAISTSLNDHFNAWRLSEVEATYALMTTKLELGGYMEMLNLWKQI